MKETQRDQLIKYIQESNREDMEEFFLLYRKKTSLIRLETLISELKKTWKVHMKIEEYPEVEVVGGSVLITKDGVQFDEMYGNMSIEEMKLLIKIVNELRKID